MKVVCIICHDSLLSPESNEESGDIVFTLCGHVFHHRCLLQWLEISKTCPQCRKRTTENLIQNAHFTFAATESDNVDNADIMTLQGSIDSLRYKVLLVERNNKHYIAKNHNLEKQNAALRQEVHKIESESRKQSAKINHMKSELSMCSMRLCQKQTEVIHYRHLYKTLSKGIQEMIEKMKAYTSSKSSLTKKLADERMKKIEHLEEQLKKHPDSPTTEKSKCLKSIVSEVQHANTLPCERENLSPQHEIRKLEKTDTQQMNTVQETDVQTLVALQHVMRQIFPFHNSKMYNSHHLLLNSVFDNSPFVGHPARSVRKRPRMMNLQPDSSSDETNDVIVDDIEINTGISLPSASDDTIVSNEASEEELYE
ncbi:PREDICTED: E3 ubiquitin-protein ligase TRAIP-like isoform X1 [Vollenhovia emeryi]|uniref:E3 ubiquitin-protein ligase TRAIP-like isoform X1 n=1 Tax=Vollenhovia emeryi TaxID=411798 RepID=UPI0005F50EA5|nr:PREDICTED: E3 ubiquitin-protein ligase TRAIP-like isoform X1 [Vollenhovia emeryi]